MDGQHLSGMRFLMSGYGAESWAILYEEKSALWACPLYCGSHGWCKIQRIPKSTFQAFSG
jgi:hypothetical protein